MKLWRDVLDSLNDALVVLSPQLDIILKNPAAEALLGSQVNRGLVEAVLGRNPWLEGMVRDCLERRQESTCADASLALAGQDLGVRAEVAPLLNEAGQFRGAVILIHDLSHQRGMELVVNGASSDRSLGLSPSGLAHEIKNPLTGIKGAAELLAGLFPSEHRAQQYCGLIVDGVSRIAELVEQVLSVSGPQRLRKDAVNIHKVLHRALGMAGLFPPAGNGIKVEQTFDPSLPEVLGDEAALERVFLNLFRNAIDAIGPVGKIRLRTRMESKFRLRMGREQRRFLRVDVSDSGFGMTPDQQAQLFTPFFTTKPNGSGLGLVLSQRIIALHDGKLWAERSEETGLTGMTFKVTLPLADGAQAKYGESGIA
ncbi:MAG TPA: ATP-binding protein [Candidatus Binataceae bacterium]|nr:ATP-binding protein [Candidatus Binataceae bacterium]